MKQVKQPSTLEVLAVLATLGAAMIFILTTFALGVLDLVQRAREEPAWQMFVAIGLMAVVGAVLLWVLGPGAWGDKGER